MYYVNKVILIGNVGADPEIRTLINGSRHARFNLATSEVWRDKQDGELRQKTEWHRISIFNDALIQTLERYIKKGSKLYLQGRLETRKWRDETGQERSLTEVVLKQYQSELVILDRTPSAEEHPPIEQSKSSLDKQPLVPASPNGDLISEVHDKDRFDDLEDEVPF